jgi:K+-transporting ATPase KdpF subunit
MNGLVFVSGVVVLGLFIYLLIALFFPEKF